MVLKDQENYKQFTSEKKEIMRKTYNVLAKFIQKGISNWH